MKKTLLFILAFTMIFSLWQGAYAADAPVEQTTVSAYLGYIPMATPVTVHINDEKLDFDVNPIISDGRTLVPMRKIFESLGSVVTWDEPTQSVTAKKDGTVVNMTVDSKTMFVNGDPVALDVAPVLEDSRVLVPARAVAESFDCKVEWEPDTQSVKIYTDSDFSFEKPVLTATEIADKVLPSVFYIEVYDKFGYATGFGSGFFITNDGVAVTNYHVIRNTYTAFITTTGGDVFNVDKIIDYNSKEDIAVIKVSKTSIDGKTVHGFPAVTFANSNTAKRGQTIYTLGSPKGLKNSMSSGIISNPNQDFLGNNYIQNTAPVSNGSSGGVLVNEFGRVLGINTCGSTEAQNLNFAVPINKLSLLQTDSEGMTYPEYVQIDQSFMFEFSECPTQVGETEELVIKFPGKKNNDKLYCEVEDENIATGEITLDVVGDGYIILIEAKAVGQTTVHVYSDVNPRGRYFTVIVQPQINQ